MSAARRVFSLHLRVDLEVAEIHGEGDLPAPDVVVGRGQAHTLFGSVQMSSGWGPDMTFCISAASATLRTMGP